MARPTCVHCQQINVVYLATQLEAHIPHCLFIICEVRGKCLCRSNSNLYVYKRVRKKPFT